MRTFSALIRLSVLALSDFWNHEVGSAEQGKPPIRYDGDPTEIYLA